MNTTSKLKQWTALTAVGVLVILAAGWFLVVSPKRSEAADLRTTAAQTATSNQALRLKLSTLKAQARDLPKQQAALAAAAVKIPDNPALPALIRALTKAADDAGVDLSTIAPAGPAAFVGALPAPAPAAAVPAAGGAAGVTASQVNAASAATLQQIAVSLTLSGSYFQVEEFLDRLESLPRALKVTGVNLAPGAGAPGAPTSTTGTKLTASLQTVVFLSTVPGTATSK